MTCSLWLRCRKPLVMSEPDPVLLMTVLFFDGLKEGSHVVG
jgi:hypothetical protein